MVDRACWAELDLSAVARNVRGLKALLPPATALCAVVKADGYGHGAVAIAKACVSSGASWLGVAFADEGVELRRAGFTEPILVLGHTGSEGARRAVAAGLSVSVVSEDNARMLSDEAVAQGRTARLHLKIDTGMERLGIALPDAARVASAIAAMPGIRLEGVSSHFAEAGALDGTFTSLQLERFLGAVAAIERAGIKIPLRHIANSAGHLFHPDSRLDMTRPGIAIYGLKASRDRAQPFEAAPAMSLYARVTQVRAVPCGETVGYVRTFKAPRDTRIAVLPVGYADGLSRALSNRGSVGFPSGRAAIAGTVCMDQVMVDVTGLPGVVPGSVATIFGKGGPPVSELAELLGTIDYEIVCAVSKRVPRVYISEDD
ncbi:MAG TPA: alanine racemase [Spirochaetaceae bacterium]|jgi:alanine racemase|nr:alanine racemase [Spirochaetaceae bacterium]